MAAQHQQREEKDGPFWFFIIQAMILNYKETEFLIQSLQVKTLYIELDPVNEDELYSS